CQQNNEAPYTF
nr:immunoglobulin light chain junction region [Mus musculus]